MYREPSSFRDPAGFLLWRNGDLLRCVTDVGKSDLEALFESGLYTKLVHQGWLVPHEEEVVPLDVGENIRRCLKPQLLAFVSYPYEWSTSQLRDAALLTLNILEISLEHGMMLKDASAFNVVFNGCKPVFIDVLSFTRRRGDEAWPGYRQFCEHFLLPLLLSRSLGEAAPGVLMQWMHGIPLQTGKRLLSWIDKIRPSVAMHVMFHAAMVSKTGATAKHAQERRSTKHLNSLVRNLANTVRSIRPNAPATKWANYREVQPYNAEEIESKDAGVRELLNRVKPETVWDIGCNDGRYSSIAAEIAAVVVALDRDAQVIGHLYNNEKGNADTRISPIVMDISKPSPALGWNSSERSSFVERSSPDLILYLAIIHHLRYDLGIPLHMQLSFLATLAEHVIIEWIPSDDVNVAAYRYRPELASLEYSEDEFRSALRQDFLIVQEFSLSGSERKLLLLRRKSDK